MARIRTIKPEFFSSEDIVSLSPLARLFFQALWCEADREGRLEWKPRTFKLRYFPGDDCDIEAMAEELLNRHLVVVYQVGNRSYAEIPTFKKHQVINNREAESEIPPRVNADDDAPLTRESGVKAEGKGKEGKGKEGREKREDDPPALPSAPPPAEPPASDPSPDPKPAKAAKATRLPSDWQLPASWGQWALTEQPSWTPEGVRHVAEQFRDYWAAKGGADARKVDWFATWRNWVRREKSPGRSRASPVMNRQEALEARNREVAERLARTM